METWKPVVGYEGWYEVSNQGRVRRMKTITSTKAGRIIGTPNNGGYPMVALCKYGKIKFRAIHHLVMESFWGPMEAGKNVDHVNGIKTDNRLENLEYVTAKENSRRAYATGLSNGLKGDRNPMAKISQSQAVKIKTEALADTSRGSLKRISNKYGVSTSLVCAIRNGRCWKWL